MNPLAAGLRQPDARSCGAASVVMARLLQESREPTPVEFRREVLACHRQLTSARADDGWQLPWPRALGTPPWAVRRELESLTGRDHRLHLVRWSPAAAYDRLAATGGVLYVGNRLLPRHVLLALAGGSDGDHTVRCYQPSRGTVVTLAREDFVAQRLHEAGWPVPWFAIIPAAAADARPAHPPSPQ